MFPDFPYFMPRLLTLVSSFDFSSIGKGIFPREPTLEEVKEQLNVDLVETEIFELVNEERKSYNLTILGHSDSLAKIAKEWSDYLAKNNSRYDIEHGDFERRIASIGYQYGCGEVIAYVPLNCIALAQYELSEINESVIARVFVDCWLGSLGHRRILLYYCKSGQMGVGVSRNDIDFYGVIDFYFA